MKKIAFVLALVCCLSMLCLPYMASDAPPHFDVTVTDSELETDEYVYLLIDLKNNNGFGAVQFSVTYDKNKLILADVTLGELLPNSILSSVNTDIAGEINFSAISQKNITDSGTVLVAKFKAVEAGTATLDFKLLAYADSDGNSLDATSSDTEITVTSPSSAEKPDTSDTEKPKDKPSRPKPKDDDEETDNKNNKKDETEDKDSADTEKPEDIDPPIDPPIPPLETPSAPPTPAPLAFSDVDASHWAYDKIGLVTGMGLFNGTSEDTFSPDLPMTRAMFVTVLHRFAGSIKTDRADFADVGDTWYTDAVSWAAIGGVVKGTGERTFSPDKYITRGEIAVILYRFVGNGNADPKVTVGYGDADTVPDWGREPIAWAIAQGIITGREGGFIAFGDNATRAEAAVIFARFINK